MRSVTVKKTDAETSGFQGGGLACLDETVVDAFSVLSRETEHSGLSVGVAKSINEAGPESQNAYL